MQRAWQSLKIVLLGFCMLVFGLLSLWMSGHMGSKFIELRRDMRTTEATVTDTWTEPGKWGKSYRVGYTFNGSKNDATVWSSNWDAARSSKRVTVYYAGASPKTNTLDPWEFLVNAVLALVMGVGCLWFLRAKTAPDLRALWPKPSEPLRVRPMVQPASQRAARATGLRKPHAPGAGVARAMSSR